MHLVGACHAKNCRKSHEALPAKDAEELKKAHAAKRESEGKSAEGGSSSGGDTPGGKPKRQIGLCNAWKRGETCARMPNCPYRHGESLLELQRVQTLRAAQRATGSKADAPAALALPIPVRRA